MSEGIRGEVQQVQLGQGVTFRLGSLFMILISFSRYHISAPEGSKKIVLAAADAKETRAVVITFLPEQRAPSSPQLRRLWAAALGTLFPGTQRLCQRLF